MRFSHADGDTRSAATSVPSTRATTNEPATRRVVTHRPAAKASRFSVRTSIMALRGGPA
jgi:hypothetical protein